ncbi:1,4-dihydroxy-2-naphthoate polyprenyltransferase [Patulibacter defluvii]|uniref:1,4-dihydroxy-2-naphthoate polyprenyltransferase n=1 Tax=Patulibacter defluvii TaxID=3095358 RepID=UPI002A751054|nr:1,4-dihydroxy-2-naphthoate polyprenyltransferase [Patulibacter sp. DM4]
MSTHADHVADAATPRPSPLRIWFLAARPKTLPVGLAPVLVGTALAIHQDAFRLGGFLAALLGALFIQVGANLSNDYSDARRGADTEDRLGPLRVTAGDLVPPQQVLIATWVSFGIAVVCGIYLIATVGWVILAIGAASIVAGVLYTGGPRPYGYEGLGELFVFLFFGLVAVTGTHYALAERFDGTALALAVPVGLMASAVLVVNNVRDIDTDRRAGKRTLAVRLGRERTRQLYAVMLGGAYVLAALIGAIDEELSPALLLVLLCAPLAVRLAQQVRSHVDGPTLNAALAGTGQLELLFCVLLSAGILVS